MICSLCYDSNDDLIYLTGDEGKLLRISSILYKYFRFCFDDEPVDGGVCRKCWLKVEMFHEFYVRIEAIHVTLRKNNDIHVESVNCSVDIGEVKLEQSSFKKDRAPDQLNGSDDGSSGAAFANDPIDSDDWTPDVEKIGRKINTPKRPERVQKISTKAKNVTKSRKQRNQKQFERLQCVICFEYFLTQNQFERHQKLTHLSLPFKCVHNQCVESFATAKLLGEHKQNVHARTECLQCGKMIAAKRLEQHMLNIHDPTQRVVCDLCGKVSSNKHLHKVHYRKIHEVQEKVQCDICKDWFKSKETIRAHMLLAHVTEEQKCEICGEVASNRRALRYHKKSHLNIAKPMKDATKKTRTRKVTKALKQKKFKSIQCDVCLEYFLTEKELERHQKITHLALPFTCTHSQCLESFLTQEDLDEHKTNDHPRTKCPICGKLIGAKKEHLEHHIKRMHDIDRQVVCEQCGKVCSDTSQHRHHVQMEHEVHEKLQCDICKEWFKNKSNMSKHLKIIHLEGPQTCPVCGKVSPNRKSLRSHKRTHMKPTKECIVCGKCFLSNSRLKEHSYIHTGVTDAYECNFCGKTFRFGSSWSAHRMKEHPVEMAEVKLRLERRKNIIKKKM